MQKDIKSTRNLISHETLKISEEIKKVNENIDEKLAPLTAELHALKTRVDSCEENKNTREKEKRKKNIVVHGIQLEDGPNLAGRATDKVIHLLKNRLEVNLEKDQIDFTRVSGKDKKGPIIMGLLSWNKKAEILSKTGKLKGTNIYIGQDFPPDVLAKRKTLIPVMMNHRKEGRHAVIRYDRLVVGKNGEAGGSQTEATNTENDLMDVESELEEEAENTEIEEKRKTHAKIKTSGFKAVFSDKEKKKKLKLTQSKLAVIRKTANTPNDKEENQRNEGEPETGKDESISQNQNQNKPTP
ncbi:hypothetical protein WDU94_013866 [Cyamophila willieti]